MNRANPVAVATPQPRRARLAWFVTAAACASAACPSAKPTVDLPAATGDITTSVVGMLSGPGAPRDPRVLVVVDHTLFVGDIDGLFLYDITIPATPALLARVGDHVIDDLAVVGTTLYAIEIAGAQTIAEFDISIPTAPTLVREAHSPSVIFGGVAARPGLIWHAVGGNPPSDLFTALGEPPCAAPDRERGAMDVWLGDGLAFETIHFDDYAGDGLDGNGAYGLVTFRIDDRTGGCPAVEPCDMLFFDTHAKNRSQFERGSASDLQVALTDDPTMIYVTGEQRLRRVAVSAEGAMTTLDELDLPDAVAVAHDAVANIVAVGNGDVLLVDGAAANTLRLAAALPTPGITRGLVFAGDGAHLYATSDLAGVLIVGYQRVAP